jgi:hypothetical protein
MKNTSSSYLQSVIVVTKNSSSEKKKIKAAEWIIGNWKYKQQPEAH